MVNILIPACGKSKFYEESFYPQNVTEINGKPMIQHIIENYKNIAHIKFNFCFFRKECDEFHTDKIASILTDNKCDIVLQENSTEGALCTALLSIDYIGNDNELIIANSDQIIDTDMNTVLQNFRDRNLDCGVISFSSVHPRWSYIRVKGEEVIETAEKHPLSNHAIAGFYYFRKGTNFIEAAKNVIRKRETYNGRFFISSSINEMILANKRVGYYEIAAEKYHSFYSPEKIKEYQKGATK